MAVRAPQPEAEGDRAFREARENVKHFGRQMLNEMLIRAIAIAYEEHQGDGPPPTYSSKDEVRSLFRRAASLELEEADERLGLAD